MLTVEAALELVLKQIPQPKIQRLPLAMVLGLTLAEPIVSDIDSPPHDKSLVDGYAARWDDVTSGRDLQVLEEVLAGAVPTHEVVPGTATRIMTGAPLPRGADSVVMVEHSELILRGDSENSRVILRPLRGSLGMNIMRRGQSLTAGNRVLPAGRRIRPVEVGMLAELGQAQVPVFAPPVVSILSTGNELVPVDQRPGPGQIRNSNGPLLQAAVEQLGAVPRNLGVALDTPAALEGLIREGLETDLLILSGGVSAGVADLVPAVLQRCGVEPIFHKIHLRPGKPLWFGTRPRTTQPTLVFGLPGNPVSSLVCFELFVRPAIQQLLGQPEQTPSIPEVCLTRPYHHRGDRPTYYPARYVERSVACERVAPKRNDGQCENDQLPGIELLNWQGSADLRTLTEADGLACFPAGDCDYAGGARLRWRPLD